MNGFLVLFRESRLLDEADRCFIDSAAEEFAAGYLMNNQQPTGSKFIQRIPHALLIVHQHHNHL